MKRENNGKMRIIPLGGLEKIGMNITAFEYEDSIIVVDCGLSFPEEDMLGIDLVIPDVTYLKDNIQKVKGFVNDITKFDYDFDLVSGRYVIDAKSIMGIFSLDLSKPIDLNIHADDNVDEIMAMLKPYLCD